MSVGLAPITSTSASVLILGSMPGVLSLQKGEYYAHPRNLFWPIMDDLFGTSPRMPYRDRVKRIVDAGVALWDVLKSCERQGSSDHTIDESTAVPNDIDSFIRKHPGIRTIYFNGAKSSRLFEGHVLRANATRFEPLARHVLPSTSPANASMSRAVKLDAWRAVRIAASKSD